MNNMTITKIIEALKRVKLSVDARSRMRETLSTYADFYTVPANAVPVSRVNTFFFGRLPYVAVAFLLLTVGGGVSYAAHGALPGSALYGVKVGVLEPVEKLLTVPTQTDAEWSLTLAQRRLDEADAVASSSGHSVERDEEAAHEVANAAREVEKNINALASSSRERASSDFSKTLSEHEETLARLMTAASTSEATDTEEILNKLFTETHERKGRSVSSSSPERTRSESTSEEREGGERD
jgi:hypothetical protein